jgi:hypothetical protein
MRTKQYKDHFIWSQSFGPVVNQRGKISDNDSLLKIAAINQSFFTFIVRQGRLTGLFFFKQEVVKLRKYPENV